MPQIDTLLSQMQRSGATLAVLRGDAPLQFSNGETPGANIGATLSNARVEELLSEILPSEAQSALESTNTAEFDYPSPFGLCRVQVRRSAGITALKIVPSFAAAPGFAPQIATQNTPPQYTTPQYTTPQNMTPPLNPMLGYAPPVEQQNTSGHKSAVLPPELRGFNWGALLLSWVWAIGNKSWLGLLGLVPIIGFFVRFFLGAKGNEMAWRNRRWQSVNQFRATQRTWAIVGLCVFVFSIPITAAVLFPVFARARENARRSACQSNMKQIALGALQYSSDKGKTPSGTTMMSWKTALKPYGIDDKIYYCPSVTRGEESYLINRKMVGVDLESVPNAAQTPLFYEAEVGHLDGINVAFADGHIKWYRGEVFESQILPELVK